MPSYRSQPSQRPLQNQHANIMMTTSAGEKRKRVPSFIDLTGDTDSDKDVTHLPRSGAKTPKTYGGSVACGPTVHNHLPSSEIYDERSAWLSTPSATQAIDDVDEIFELSQGDGAGESNFHYGNIDTKIVGVQYYRGIANPGEFILMRREPGNPYDANAIRVDNVGFQQIGHIPRRIAAKLAPYLDSKQLSTDGRLTGVVGQFDCPVQIKIYGPDPDTYAGQQLIQKLAAEKVPVNIIKAAEKAKKDRQKAENKRQKALAVAEKLKQAEQRRAALVTASSQGSSQVQIPPGSQGFQGHATPGGNPFQQPNILEAGQRFSPREVGQTAESYGLQEEALKALPTMAKPESIITKMLPYQLQALRWLLDHENPSLPALKSGAEGAVQLWSSVGNGIYNNLATNFSIKGEPQLARGGILADDMGLGKTLEMISLIVSDAATSGRGTTLVIAPLSVMSNWKDQIAEHVDPAKALKVYIYHGAQRVTMKSADFSEYDVVITTYQTLASDYIPRGTGKKQPGKGLRPTGLYSVDFRRVILDEGHTVRNPQAKGTLAVTALTARSKWALTGTPIVNSLKDLYSLLRFIGVTGGLEQFECFNTCLIRPLKQGDPAGSALLQAVMAAFSLRRKKEMEFINLRLPKLEEFIHRIEFTPKEATRYAVLFDEAKGIMSRFSDMTSGSDKFETYQHLLTLLLRLRQCCNHWQLCGERVTDLMQQLEAAETVKLTIENSKALQDILQVQIESHEECPICLESLHSPVITACAHAFGKECITRVIEAQQKCPMCRAKLEDESWLVEARNENGDEEADDGMDLTQSSSKLERLVQILGQTREVGPADKTIVFSQWTRFLDIVQARLDREGFKYCRIDGTMSAARRDAALKALKDDADCTIMLASLGVCAVGLNLTAANQVILSDTWWAPAIEDQAVDRVHRLGQTRETRVFRLVMDQSIEEHTLEIQKDKRKLMMAAFAETTSKRGNAKAGRMADVQRILAGEAPVGVASNDA